jgi:hypothetical protein
MSKSIEFSKQFIYLPVDNSEMENFLESNRDLIYLYITNKIKNSILSGEDCAELFGFKGTEYRVMIHKDTFPSTLDKYFNYFMENEIYEGCSEVNKAKETLSIYNDLVKQKII